MKNVKFEGIIPAFVTPFNEDNKTINVESAKKLIDLHLEQGANGFYILGGTGEGLVMAREEREAMCEIAVKYVNGRKPVINHVGAKNMEETVALAKHAEKVGADAVASVPPSFFYYREDDLFNYYKKLAESVSIPVIIYYHPAAQKDMSAKLIAKIFEIDNVTGVKWSSNNFFELMKLKDMTHGEMNIINGPDELLVSGLAAGADAGIGSTYNVMLPEFVKIYEHFKKGELDKALEMQLKVNRVISAMIAQSVVPAVKHAVNLMGINVGTATYPLNQITDEKTVKEYEAALKEAGWPFNR